MLNYKELPQKSEPVRQNFHLPGLFSRNWTNFGPFPVSTSFSVFRNTVSIAEKKAARNP